GAKEEFLQNYAYRQKKFSPEEVIFVIKPSKIKIAQLYQQADIFVFASITETQGLVIMEALAAGTPVIATNRPVINEVIKEGENGFLTETSAEMAQKITWLSNNENVWEQLQKNAFKSAYTYQITKTAEKLVQFYKKISHL
ncbi:MAG: glycosyltransferase, partial [Candidatus Babeliaceae bacterium]